MRSLILHCVCFSFDFLLCCRYRKRQEVDKTGSGTWYIIVRLAASFLSATHRCKTLCSLWCEAAKFGRSSFWLGSRNRSCCWLVPVRRRLDGPRRGPCWTPLHSQAPRSLTPPTGQIWPIVLSSTNAQKSPPTERLEGFLVF